MKRTNVSRIKTGSAAVGKAKARQAIKRAVAGVTELNERRVREREETKAAALAEVRIVQSAIEKLIEQDEAAKIAIGKLRRQGSDLNLRLDRTFEEALRPAQQSLLALTLHQHVHVIGLPYDFGWNWGNPNLQVSDPAYGWAGVFAYSNRTSAAAAGIGVILTTDKPAIVSVRPFIRYTWQYQMIVSGIGSNADVRGGIDWSAWVDGTLLSPGIRRHQAFSDSISWVSKRNELGDGDAPMDQVSLDFTMAPGKVYSVNFGSWVECEHENWIGSAASGAKVEATIPFIAVLRFVAG
ncbi:MAG: hypothetical protein ACREBG_01245 [Pyrinomonadaceae bacterium]